MKNFDGKFGYIKPAQTLPVRGYEEAEVRDILKTNSLYQAESVERLMALTGGLPFYIWVYVKNNKDSKGDKDDLINSPDTKYWLTQSLMKLNQDERRLLKTLCLLNDIFSTMTAQALCDKLQISNAEESFRALERHYFIETIGGGNYKTLEVICADFNLKYKFDDELKLHDTIAVCIWPDERFVKNQVLNINDCKQICKAIMHLQLAKNFAKSYRYLNRVIPTLKIFGLYRSAITLLNFELDHNPYVNKWMIWHCAHCYFITGELLRSYQLLNTCLKKALPPLHWKNRPEDEVTYFLKTFTLLAELVAVLLPYETALEVMRNGLHVFKPQELEFKSKQQALSLLSWLYINSGEPANGIAMNQTMMVDHWASNDQGNGVLHTRLGVGYLQLGETAKAQGELEKACVFFRQCKDKRGLAWSQRYLAKCYHHLSSEAEEQMLKLINEVLVCNSEAELFDQDYVDWLAFFNECIEKPFLKRLVVKERQRVLAMQVRYQDDFSKEDLPVAIQKLLQELPKRTGSFDYRPYIQPFLLTSLPSNSLGMHSFINKVSKNPLPFLEELFKNGSEKVFASPPHNKVIGEILKKRPDMSPFVLDNYIIPYLGAIKAKQDPGDSIKYHYARVLQYADRFDDSLSVLDAIRPENYHFEYYNIAANCYRRKRQYQTSYIFYMDALAHTEEPDQKGRAHHNLALLSYQLNRRSTYPDAIVHCHTAIRLRERDQEFVSHVIKTLFLIEIENGSDERSVEIAANLADRFLIKPDLLNSLISEVKTPLKKRKLTSHFTIHD